MIEHTLGGFQRPPTLTQEIMRRIPIDSAATAPTSKPLVPWITATALAAVMLLVGLVVTTTRFQLPYSLNAPESATMVEIVDAPIIEMPAAKVTNVKRTGASKAGAAGNGNWENGSIWAAAADSRNDTESGSSGWTQTNGPYGGHVTALHATPEGILFAGTYEAGVFRSNDGGETWTTIVSGLPDGGVDIQLVDGTTLYGTSYFGVFRLTHGSDSWEKTASMIQPYVPSTWVYSLAFDGTTLYAGTEAEGVFRLSLDE